MELHLWHYLRHSMPPDSPRVQQEKLFLVGSSQALFAGEFRLSWNASAGGNASTNSSPNASVSSATALPAVAVPDWFLRYASIYLVPLLILLGLLNNGLVLWVMPRARVAVPTRVKRLYVGIAFGDLLTTISKNLVYYYFEDGLFYTTNGAFWACDR